jgi:hypothetical protein
LKRAPFPLSIALLATACGTVSDGGQRFLAGGSPVGDYRLPVKSVTEMRFAGVIRQRYDFSCGSAALATLLRFHYDFDVGEEAAFRGMWAHGDRVQIQRAGFSLLDMKRWLASRGIAGDGYKVSLDKIAETGVPGIALIAISNYRHFVVIKGIDKKDVLLGDPSAGLSVMPIEKFKAAWNGIYFVLGDDQPLAKSNFNRPSQWAAYARAPLGARYSDPVSLQALQLTAPFYGDIS